MKHLLLYILFFVIFSTTACYSQRYVFDYSNKEWKPEDFVGGVTKVTAYEYKIKKNGKVKRDSTVLYSQIYEAKKKMVSGSNYISMYTIGYNDKAFIDRDYYNFETYYSSSGKFLLRKAASKGGPIVTDSTNNSVLGNGPYEIHKSTTETSLHKPSAYSTLKKMEKTYNENGLITQECSTYTDVGEQCENIEYIYVNSVISKITQTNCRGEKIITYFKHNSIGLINEEKDTFEGKIFKLVRYFYE